ncbi:MAG TPA: cyanophycin synthetase [Oscillospiraceae bacterium]|nr:cyanophycin synthetase [Oscillospiraceae bacterium]
MKIVDLHFYTGRNIYSHYPVMRMLLDLESFQNYRTDCDPTFASRILQALPTLCEHTCSRRRPGGFIERVKEGTYLGHVVEHVFLELQHLAGIGAKYGKTYTGDGRFVEIISEYRCEQAARILAEAAVQYVRSLATGVTGENGQVAASLAAAKKAASLYLPGPSTAAVLAAARRRQIPYQQLQPGTSLYRLGTGKYQKRIQASLTNETGCIATDIACSKPLTKKILAQHGLPVPKGRTVSSAEEAVLAAQEIGFPVAMKPDNGNQGKGVSLNLNSMAEVQKAFSRAAVFSPSVMVEACLDGRHYRLLVVKGQLAAAAERLPAFVTGDGIHTISELVSEENKNPLRGDGHEKPLTKISLDGVAEEVLLRQGMVAQTVVPASVRVYLRDNANLSTGGTSCDVTDEVHPQQIALAVQAASYIGLDVAGVDLVMKSIALPPAEQAGGIIEVNAAPGLRMHLYPSVGKKRDVGEKIVSALFPFEQPTRVPVISITGTNGKTTTTRMLEYVMRQQGLFTGMCCTDGLYYNGQLARSGDLTGPDGAGSVLAHPEVEVAVLETARGGIVRRGLGYERADVAVICNVREDHLGQDGIESLEDLVHVKSLVAEAVYENGTVILNADEANVTEIAARVWERIIYFSRQEDNIIVRRHLGKGGRALFIRRGAIVAAQGNRVVLVGRVRDFAVTFAGRAQHQVENLLAALAACWGTGLSPRQAGFYLRNFTSSPQDNPGRANLYQVGSVQVLVDYGHNPDGFAKIGDLVRKINTKRTLAVIGVPGDRCNELIFTAGKTAAQFFDHLLIKEDADLRGRRPGEVTALLREGALAAGIKLNCITEIAQETKAVRTALQMAAAGDLVVVFYEELEPVIAEIIASQQQQRSLLTAPKEKKELSYDSPAMLT